MPNDAEIIIGVDAETEKVDKKINKVLNEYSKKKIELDLQLKDQSLLKRQLKELDNQIKDLDKPAPNLINSFNDINNELKRSISNTTILREQLKALSSEFRNLFTNQTQISGLLPAKATDVTKFVPNYYGFFKEIDKLKDELSQKIKKKSSLEDTIVRINGMINKFGQTSELMSAFNGVAERIKIVNNEIKQLNNQIDLAKNRTGGFENLFKKLEVSSKSFSENFAKDLKNISNISGLLPEKASDNIKNSFSNFGKIFSNISSSVSNTFGRITSSFKNFNFHAINSSRHVDYFGRRIFNLLRNAFVFNVISRQFRGLSTLLGNLVNRDIYFAKSLMIVKANLVRAFAPIWQIILPWIRALGDGLVWISNQLIRFINFLTGSKIKPLQGFQEAKQVVDDFNRIASPTKDLFDLKDPNEQARKLKKSIKDTQDESYRASKNAERLAKRLNNSQKQTTKLLAKFDKLEVLKFKKTKDPLDDISNVSKNKGLDIPINFPSIEDQISNAINNIKDKPLDFYVNDNIDEQITSQVNGLTLPALDFKVSEESQESVDNFKKKLLDLWSTIEPLAKAISKFFVELVKSFGRLFVDEDGKENKTLKTIVNGFTNFFNLISDNKNNMDTLRNFIIGLGIALITYKIAKMVVDITTTFTALFELLAGAFSLSNPVGWAALAIGCLYLIVKHWGGVKKAVEDVWDKMKEFGNWIKYKFTELWDWLKRNFIDPIANAFGKIGSWFNSKFGWHSGSYSGGNLYSVPGLAQGSVLKGGDPFLAYLNDQPRGQTNVEAPLSTIVDAFKQALSESDYNSQPEININASGDMSSFVRMLNFKLQDNKKILGNAFINDINF